MLKVQVLPKEDAQKTGLTHAILVDKFTLSAIAALIGKTNDKGLNNLICTEAEYATYLRMHLDKDKDVYVDDDELLVYR